MNCCFMRLYDRRGHFFCPFCPQCSFDKIAVSAPLTAGMGLSFFCALLEELNISKDKAVVDCGMHRGMAMAAMAQGFKIVICEETESLRAFAHAHGAQLWTCLPHAEGCRASS